MNKYMQLINDVHFIQSISLEDRTRYLNDGSFIISEHKKNNVVHLEGESCFQLEIILSGIVVIDRIDEEGNLMTITEFSRGEIIGGNLIFSNNPVYPLTATAKEQTIILAITKERMFQLCSTHTEFLQSYLEYVSDHAVILSERIKHYVNRTIRESVMSYLLNEQKKQATNKIKLGMTKKALAERIGVQRTSLSRELAKMQADGLIAVEGDVIVIL